MTLVANKTVKMEWDKSLWLQTKGKGSVEGAFIFAGKEYDSTKYGKICVGFTSIACFLFTEEDVNSADDIWSGAEMKQCAKDNMGDFPLGFEGGVYLAEVGTTNFDDELLEKYGLSQYKDDLIARMKDVGQYATTED